MQRSSRLKEILHICKKRSKSVRFCTFALSIFTILSIIMLVIMLSNLPKKINIANNNKEIKNLHLNNNATKQLEDNKDLYIRSVTFGEQKAAILQETGIAVFYGAKQLSGDVSENYSAIYNPDKVPQLQIRAIIKADGKIAACVDINGIAEGIMMTPGMLFMDYGKIISINDKGIQWEWNGKPINSNI